MVTDFHTSSSSFAAPRVDWITRGLNAERRAMSGEPKPATELCGQVAEFMGMFGDDEDLETEAGA